MTEYPNETFSAIVIFKEDGTCKIVLTEDGDTYVSNATWIYADDKLVVTEEDNESMALDILSCTKKIAGYCNYR